MDYLYNNKAACVVTALLILFSIFGLGGNKLNDRWKRAEEVFVNGGDNDLTSVQAEIDKIAGNASNILVIAGKHKSEDDEGFKNVQADIDSLWAAESLNEKADRLKILTRSASELSINLVKEDRNAGLGMNNSDRDYLVSLLADIEASVRKIGYASYNEYARAQNMLTDNFYTSAVMKLRGIEPLPVFSEME